MGWKDKLEEISDPTRVTRERVMELAKMTAGFGLQEFIEVTGVGKGKYGIYQISEDGVRVGQDVRLEDLAAERQLSHLKVTTELSLDFPCAASDFWQWFQNTRGTPDGKEDGISDFPLNQFFIEAIEHGTVKRLIVPSHEIVQAFRVKADSAKNELWWDVRMRDAKRYGLIESRAAKGRAKSPSRWYPEVIAAWLVENQHQHMTVAAVKLAIERNFPDADTAHLW
jgi:hypothetical protein